MKPVVSPLLRSARLILPAAALLAATAGTAALATPAQAGISAGHVRNAPARPVTSAKLSWHPFKLLHGWKSATAKKLLTGTPAWALQNGVVYLRGAIRQPTAGGTAFASLPKQARPAEQSVQPGLQQGRRTSGALHRSQRHDGGLRGQR